MDIEQIPSLFVLALVGVGIFVAGFFVGLKAGMSEGTNTAYRALLEQHQILAPTPIDSEKETESVK